MLRRRLLLMVLGLTGLAAVGLTVVAWLVGPSPHRISVESFEKIKAGMTEAEVLAVFGVPPGDYMRSRTIVALRVHGVGRRTGECKEWRSDEGIFLVWFDGDGIVSATNQPLAVMSSDDSLLDKLRRWLGL